MQNRLKSEGEQLDKDFDSLKKKEDYLEKTYQNSKDSIEQVLKGGGR